MTTPIQRVSADDATQLATGSTTSPAQVGAVLLLDGPITLAAVRAALADRVGSVRRLRQRLQRVPLGCGRPIWVDYDAFAIQDHVLGRECPRPGDEAALLEVAAAAVGRALPADRPLWSVTVVNGLAAGRSALVLVLHHVVADGIGGLAVLARLVDGAPGVSDRPFPVRPPERRELITDAVFSWLRAMAKWRSGVRLVRAAARELLANPVVRVSRSSLNQPTDSRRRLAVARTDLAGLSATAHAHGGTVNDSLLAAVAGTLAAVLEHRGESADFFVLSESVSVRRDAAATQLGNQVIARPVKVPARGDPMQRLAAVVETTRAVGKSGTTGAPAALLGPALRILARLRIFRSFVDHQRLVTSLVTNVRGPNRATMFLGTRIIEMVPISMITGNVTVGFAALSYGGALTVTVITDPDRCPDLPLLVAELQNQLDRLTSVLPLSRLS